MAKTALINKANKKPKFAVRGYTRCNRCGRPHSVYRKSRDGTRGRTSGYHQELLVTTTPQVRADPETTAREADRP